MDPDATPPVPAPSLPRQIFNYLWRATLLKCPVCGTRPMFLPLARVRNFGDWFTPLDGCPRCGYAYDREPGYFLISQWGIGYGVSALVGIGVYVWLQIFHSDWSYTKTLLAVAIPLPFVNFLIARHCKSYFLAVDHLCDPHISLSDEDDEGGAAATSGVPSCRPHRTCPPAPIPPGSRAAAFPGSARPRRARKRSTPPGCVDPSTLPLRRATRIAPCRPRRRG